MQAANASLVVSIIALSVAVAVAGWNVLKYVLDGGRIRVRLERGYLDDSSLRSGAFRSVVAQNVFGPHPELHVEVGILRVENLGRTAVTVYEPSFDVGWRWSWRRLRLYRWTVAPLAFRFNDSRTDSVVRLDPFDFAIFILDADPAVRAKSYESKWRRRRVLRGSVRVAGKRLRRRSGVLSAWRLPLGAKALTEPITIGQAVYRTVYRETRPTTTTTAAPPFVSATYAAHLATEAWKQGETLSVERLTEILAECTPNDEEANFVLLPITLHFQLRNDGFLDGDGQPMSRTFLLDEG